jgi:hypothetical protein
MDAQYEQIALTVTYLYFPLPKIRLMNEHCFGRTEPAKKLLHNKPITGECREDFFLAARVGARLVRGQPALAFGLQLACIVKYLPLPGTRVPPNHCKLPTLRTGGAKRSHQPAPVIVSSRGNSCLAYGRAKSILYQVAFKMDDQAFGRVPRSAASTLWPGTREQPNLRRD